MDVLEDYKKAWSKQATNEKQLSKSEIYKIAHARSSSIVKWIFIISILEFVVFNSLYLFLDMDKAYHEYEKLGLLFFINSSSVIFYIILAYFIYMFYRNYKNISTSDSTSVLMDKILKTRKTVRNYVIFNLSYIALCFFVVTIATINLNENDFTSKQTILVVLFMLIASLLILGLMYLFYQLIYGILLNKLKRNYRELSKLES